MKATTLHNASRLLILAGFLIVSIGAYFLGRGTSTSPPQEILKAKEPSQLAKTGIVRFEPEALQLADLRIETVRLLPFSRRLIVSGQVEPNPAGMVKVTPRVVGKITKVLVNVGDPVQRGQPLALLASTELAEAQAAYRQASTRVAVARNHLERQKRLAHLGAFSRHQVEEARARFITAQGEVQKAESELSALQAVLAQAETQVQVARSRLNRAELLFKELLLSRQDYEGALADYQKAQADLQTALAHLKQGETALQTARRQAEIASQALAREEAIYKGGYLASKERLEAEATYRQALLEQKAAADDVRLLGGMPGGGNQIAITAPIEGRITERLVTLGETVSPEKSLFTILNLSTVWVQLNVYQKDLPHLRVGQVIIIASEAAPGRTFRGSVSYISDLLDETTRTVKVRCVIQNEGNRLKPGMFVTGTILKPTQRRVIAVPQEAVQRLEDQTVLFMPTEQEGEFRAQPVELGEQVDRFVEIRSGLKAGDRIVTKNAFIVMSQAMKSELGEEE